jgi:hypothetical protein
MASPGRGSDITLASTDSGYWFESEVLGPD